MQSFHVMFSGCGFKRIFIYYEEILQSLISDGSNGTRSHPPKTFLSLVEQRPNQLVVRWRNFKLSISCRGPKRKRPSSISGGRENNFLQSKNAANSCGFVTLSTAKGKIPSSNRTGFFAFAGSIQRDSPNHVQLTPGGYLLCSELFFCESLELHLPCCG